MARKSKVKRRTRRGRRTTAAVRERVRALRARGFSEDRISHELSLSKNTLRARHAPDLDAGREIARAASEAAERAQLTTRQREIFDAISAGFGTEWDTPELGCLVQHGARDVSESLRMYLKYRGHDPDDPDLYRQNADLVAIAGVVLSLEK